MFLKFFLKIFYIFFNVVFSHVYANDIPKIMININDHSCDPMVLNILAGKNQFIITNNSTRAVEWEILQGVMIIEERENIAPGFKQKLTAILDIGEYDMTCGLLSNPKGKIFVKGNMLNMSHIKNISSSLIHPIQEYKKYVMQEVKKLVLSTKSFITAIKNDNVKLAKKKFASTRKYYERIEVIAELFSDLDTKIDAHENDYEKKDKDPNFRGFHRLEKVLFKYNTTRGIKKYAEYLYYDILTLQKRIEKLIFPPSKVVGGAANLIEEIAFKKISGEENPYSRTDLSDINGNLDGAKKIVNLLSVLISTVNAELLINIDKNFKNIEQILKKYKTNNGYKKYDTLIFDDFKMLQKFINVLSEDLSLLRGTLGLD